jgi:hypothetical protein
VRNVFLALVLSLTASGRVYIATMPSVMQAGDNVRLTCTVPKHPDNRWLTIGISGYRTSTFQLDGEDAAITHTFIVQHVSCDTPIAVCQVKDNLGKTYEATRELGMIGCGEN